MHRWYVTDTACKCSVGYFYPPLMILMPLGTGDALTSMAFIILIHRHYP